MIVLAGQIDKQIDRGLKAVQGGSNRGWTLPYRNMLFGTIDPPKWRQALERSVRGGLPRRHDGPRRDRLAERPDELAVAARLAFGVGQTSEIRPTFHADRARRLDRDRSVGHGPRRRMVAAQPQLLRIKAQSRNSTAIASGHNPNLLARWTITSIWRPGGRKPLSPPRTAETGGLGSVPTQIIEKQR
jgi:hypothetical protein